MKQSEKLWIQNLARVSLGKPLKASCAAQLIQQSVSVFFDELCSLMITYANYFNELIVETKPQDCNRIFQTSQPRPGLIILKGGDKMIISLEGKMIRVRTVQVHLDSERNFQSYDFGLKQNEVGAVIWSCLNDGQAVNPQLVAEHYLTSFLVSGCRAISQTLRLVAVASHP